MLSSLFVAFKVRILYRFTLDSIAQYSFSLSSFSLKSMSLLP